MHLLGVHREGLGSASDPPPRPPFAQRVSMGEMLSLQAQQNLALNRHKKGTSRGRQGLYMRYDG